MPLTAISGVPSTFSGIGRPVLGADEWSDFESYKDEGPTVFERWFGGGKTDEEKAKSKEQERLNKEREKLLKEKKKLLDQQAKSKSKEQERLNKEREKLLKEKKKLEERMKKPAQTSDDTGQYVGEGRLDGLGATGETLNVRNVLIVGCAAAAIWYILKQK